MSTSRAVPDLIKNMSGSQIGYGYAQIATSSSTTSIIPQDNTIPQSSEGVSLGVDVTINVKRANSLLEVVLNCDQVSASGLLAITAALFRDAEVNAFAAGMVTITGSNYSHGLTVARVIAAGVAGPTTFKARWGVGSSTGYINKITAGDYYGGVMHGIRMTVREIAQ